MSLPKSLLKSRLTFDEIVRDEVAEILKGNCTDCKYFEDLTEAINRIEVKHANKNKKNVKTKYLLLETVDLDDTISHLFVVYIHFDQKIASAKTNSLRQNISSTNQKR